MKTELADTADGRENRRQAEIDRMTKEFEKRHNRRQAEIDRVTKEFEKWR